MSSLSAPLTSNNANGNAQQQGGLSLSGKFDANFKTRDNSPSRRKSHAPCWQYVKRLDPDHPKSSEFTHLCTVENCNERFMKLFKPKDKDYWVTSRANEHLRDCHAIITEQHQDVFINKRARIDNNIIQQQHPPTALSGFDSICKQLLKLGELKEKDLVQPQVFELMFEKFNDQLMIPTLISPTDFSTGLSFQLIQVNQQQNSNQQNSHVFEDIADQLLQLKLLQDKSLLRGDSFEKLKLEFNSCLMLQAHGAHDFRSSLIANNEEGSSSSNTTTPAVPINTIGMSRVDA